jgi:hypothetical protein
MPFISLKNAPEVVILAGIHSEESVATDKNYESYTKERMSL